MYLLFFACNNTLAASFRLYAKGIFTGFKRGQRSQKNNCALVAVQNCKDRRSSTFYHGKRVAYIYRKKNSKTGINYKAIWGRVTASHGQSGMVRVKFARNMPSQSMGAQVRVMLYPNKQI